MSEKPPDQNHHINPETVEAAHRPPERPTGEAGQDSLDLELLVSREHLKSIFDRATSRYDDKYQTAIIGANFELSEDDINEVGSLIDVTRTNLDTLKQQEPLWPQFASLLDEFRGKFGSFGEQGSVITGPDVSNIEKVKIDGRPGIKVPERLRNLDVWDTTLQNFTETITAYVKGQSHGRSGRYIGRDIKELYRFNYEMSLMFDRDKGSEQ